MFLRKVLIGFSVEKQLSDSAVVTGAVMRIFSRATVSEKVSWSLLLVKSWSRATAPVNSWTLCCWRWATVQFSARPPSASDRPPRWCWPLLQGAGCHTPGICLLEAVQHWWGVWWKQTSPLNGPELCHKPIKKDTDYIIQHLHKKVLSNCSPKTYCDYNTVKDLHNTLRSRPYYWI